MTELETKIYDTIFAHCTDDFSSSVAEVAEDLGIDVATVKGAVGSLVKKGLVLAETEVRGGKEFMDLFPLKDGQIYAFGEWS